MATIPLPALDVKPLAQQPGPMEQYGQLMAIQNAKQDQQLRQQQMQGVEQENQMRQLQLQDQQNLRSAAKGVNWSQPDAFDKFLTGAQESGVSPTTLSQLSMQRQQYLKSVADTDVATNTANLANNNTLLGHIETLEGITDPTKRASAAQTIGQQILSEGSTKNPQILQTAQAMAGGQMVPTNDQLDSFKAGLLDHKTVLSDALKKQQIATSQAQQGEAEANTKKTNAEMDWYKAHNLAPGVTPDTAEMADYLFKNPGKGPSDYKLWTLQHTPTAMVMGNMLAGPQNQDALDLAANNYRLSGQMPPGLYRSPGTTQAIIARAAQLDQQNGGEGIAANKSILQANTKSLDNLQKNYDQVQAFEQTASKNMDLLQQTAQKIPDLGARYANIPVRMINAKMLGTENMAAFNTALNTAQTEAAKALNSSNASGVLSDSARHELQQLIDGNMTYGAMVASLNTLKQDMNNRTQSYQMQISDIQRRIKGAGTTPQNVPSTNTGAQGGGDPFSQFGGKAH